MTNLKLKAQAVAELDAICDEFEQACNEDATNLTSLEETLLTPWVQRVDPELQTWLRNELVALRQDILVARGRGRNTTTETSPEGVLPAVWDAVSGCETFAELSYEAIVALARSIETRNYPAESYLLQSGQESSGLILILAGQVSIVAHGEDGCAEIDVDGPGSILGEMSMLTGHRCTADVIAKSNVDALVLPVEAFHRIREPHPEVEIALSQLVNDRLGTRSLDALCGKTLGGFRLHRCVGNGAMGVVYSAVRESDSTEVALKMMRHRFIYDDGMKSRFDQEAQFLSGLEHPNLVSLLGHFVEYRTRFIVLDLYDGADLREVIHKVGPMSEPTVRAVLGQIAAGLRHAHQCGVLHLDLKPANVLVDRHGKVAITDFGLGRLIKSDGRDRQVVGTPLYMPPEQFTMTDIGPRCDWYAFACIGYELLTGEKLFQAKTSASLRSQKRRQPSEVWPSMQCSEELRLHLVTALQPLADHRDLDLDEIASWACPVPELAIALD